MAIPENLSYTNEHEWVKIENGVATIGITDHAQEELGDITYVELPAEGASVNKGDELAVVESVKAASDVYAPVGGTVASINAALEDAPENVNRDPYGDGWMCTLTDVPDDDRDGLMSADEYRDFLATA